MFAKTYHLHYTVGRANVFCKYLIYIFFSILRVDLVVLILCYFQKLQLLVVKTFEIIFAAFYFYLYKLENLVSDF